MSSPSPLTFVEQLDAAQTGEEFGQALNGLFAALDRARQNEERDQ